MSNPNVSPYSARFIAEELENTKARAVGYEFWPDEFSISAWLRTMDREVASSKITDVYLLGLVVRNGGVLATFDRAIQAELIGHSGETIVEQIPF